MDHDRTILSEILDVKIKQKKKKRNGKSLIDCSILPAKLSYFFSFALFGSFMPYINVFLTSIGLSTTQAGLISGLRTLVSFIIGPIWGYLVDYTGRRKLIYAILGISTISFIFPLPWIANHIASDLIMEKVNRNIIVNHTYSHIAYLHNITTKPAIITNFSDKSNETGLYEEEEDSFLQTKLFYVMLFIMMVSAATDLPMLGFQDSIVMNLVSSSKRKATFGFQRVFGSIGFGIANFAAGVAADSYIRSSFSSYTAIFFISLPAGIMMIPFGVHMINQEVREEETSRKTKTKTNILPSIFKTCCEPSNLIFLLTTLVAGIGSALYYGFTFLLMEEYMNASSTIMGLSIAVSSACEVLIFPIASKLIKLFGGTIPCIIIGVFSYFIRFILISYVENPWLVLPIQLTHAGCFALFWAAAIHQIELISTPEIRATMFSILTGLHFALSTVIGCVLGGYVYERVGGRLFYRASSFIFLVWGVLLVIYFYGIKRIHQNKEGATLVCDKVNLGNNFKEAQKTELLNS